MGYVFAGGVKKTSPSSIVVYLLSVFQFYLIVSITIKHIMQTYGTVEAPRQGRWLSCINSTRQCRWRLAWIGTERCGRLESIMSNGRAEAARWLKDRPSFSLLVVINTRLPFLDRKREKRLASASRTLSVYCSLIGRLGLVGMACQ